MELSVPISCGDTVFKRLFIDVKALLVISNKEKVCDFPEYCENDRDISLAPLDTTDTVTAAATTALVCST